MLIFQWNEDEDIIDAWLYAHGMLKPRYPVPSLVGPVRYDAYPGIICIDYPNGDDWCWGYDCWEQRQLEVVNRL